LPLKKDFQNYALLTLNPLKSEIEKALPLMPEHLQAHTVIATVLIKQEKYKAALQSLNKILDLSEQQGQRGYHFIFNLLGRQRDKQASLSLMEQLLQSRSPTPEALFAYGRLALLVDNLDKATDAVQQLIEMK